MIVVIATIRVYPDKVSSYETACKELLPEVRAAEPGIVFYDVSKSRDEIDTYRVVEIYKNEDALSDHLSNKDFEEQKAYLFSCIEDITIKMHDTLT